MHVADKLALDLHRPIDMREDELVALELRHARGIPIQRARIIRHRDERFTHANRSSTDADFQKLRRGGSRALAAELRNELGVRSGLGDENEDYEGEQSSRPEKRISFCRNHVLTNKLMNVIFVQSTPPMRAVLV